MEGSLHKNYLKYKRIMSQKGERPVIKGPEVVKGVNVLGNQRDISLGKFQETVMKLKDYSDMPLKSSPEDIKRSYQEVVRTMGLVTNTPTYDTFSNMLAKNFSETGVLPGTIASDLSGCHTKYKGAEVVEPGCTPTCAGSLKANNDSQVCQHKIYTAEQVGNGLVLRNLFNPSVKGNAYIYIGKSKDLKYHQPKVDAKTKELLAEDGVAAVRFIGYDATNMALTSVNEEWIPLDQLGLAPKRTVATTRAIKESSVDQMSQWDKNTWILIGLIAVGVLLYLFFNR